MTKSTKIIFRNKQWMVQQDRGTVYLVEVVQSRPDDIAGGFWISAAGLATAKGDGYSELSHICEKNWVDIDLLEAAVKVTIEKSGATPNYDIDAEFASLRRMLGKAA